MAFTELPANTREDTRRCAEQLLMPMLAGAEWSNGLRRSPEELASGLATLASPEKIRQLIGLVALEGHGSPWLPIPYRITPVVSGIHVALAVVANLIGEARGVGLQPSVLNTDHATTSVAGHFAATQNGMSYGDVFKRDIELLKKEALEKPAPGQPGQLSSPSVLWYLWSQTLMCKDGRAIFMYQKFDDPASLLRVVGFKEDEIPSLMALCDPARSTREDRERFRDTLASHVRENWNSYDLEAHIIKQKIGAVLVPRSRSEFLASPQGRQVGWRPPLEFTKFSSPSSTPWSPRPFSPLTDPSKGLLQGIRVVELTRALMGARMGTVLGYTGATVVKATSPYLQDFGILSIAHNLGKLSIFLDLKKEEDKERLRGFVREADVFIQNYAYGACERLGFGAKDVFEMVKDRGYGIVYVSCPNESRRALGWRINWTTGFALQVEGNAFGFGGPYATAPGFEHLAQAMSGLGS